MRTTPILLASLLLSAALSAQADAAPTEPRAVFDRLATEWQAAQTAYRTAMTAVTESADYKAAQAAKDAAKTRDLLASVRKPDLVAYATRGLEAARACSGEDQMRFLVWLAVENGHGDSIKQAIELVREHHVQSPQMEQLLENGGTLSRAVGADVAAALLERVVADSPHPRARAWAMYWQALSIRRDRNADAAAKERAGKLLAEAEQLAEGTLLADRIAGPRFEKERLQIGMAAPDIAGEDVDGVPFQLSDYHGKVVVLDFWGFW
ncbi:MAG: redoxin domain-containing protein [Planctomycetes bacterium]|nr:redoxin domain-containing protein [Planctomycetota bacterium]